MHQKKQLDFDEIIKLVNAPLKKGDSWYLLDKKWFDVCRAYHESGDKNIYPGAIDNSALFQPLHIIDCEVVTPISIDSKPLRQDLSEAEGHFVLVPENCWNILKDVYGVTGPDHAIKRRVIETAPGQTIVEIKPISLRLCLYGAKETNIERRVSRMTTLEELQQDLKTQFEIGPDRETRIWVNSASYTIKPVGLSPSKSENSIQSTSPNKLPPTPPPMPSSNSSTPTVITRQAANSMKPIALPDSSSTSISDLPTVSRLRSNTTEALPTQTLADSGVSDSAVVTLEVINGDGTWPSCRPRFGTVSTRSSKAQPGLCGLSNMGNTCFMNSALQCLSNTPPLTNYILTDKFVDDINPNNPLGMHGEIARTYAELIKVMWSGNNTSFLPREFKCAVSRFAPQFNGFAQQDCQELMAFLLDGLHEDLNRIRNKPYIEIKTELEQRPDGIVAEESWSNYKKRNDSIVVDTFHAMLKSTLVCPGCELVSVTFDPFCYLSLPLPVKREKQVNLTFLPAPSKINESKITEASFKKKLDSEEIETIKHHGGSISSFSGIMENLGGYAVSANRAKGCKMQVPRSGPASEILSIVARIINEEKLSQSKKVERDNLVMAELSLDGKITKVYEANEHYNSISDDIVVVEKASNYAIPLYIRERKTMSSTAGSVLCKPVFLHVPDLKFDTLYKSIIASLSNLTDELHDRLQEDDKAYDEWFKLVRPVDETNGKLETEDQMDCEDDNSNAMVDSTGDDEETAPNMRKYINDVLTNGSPSKKKYIKSSGNAFDICTVNSFGNHSFETLGVNKKECEYSTKLYLGATFTQTIGMLPQFMHIHEAGFNCVETFAPKVSPRPTLQLKDCITQFTNVERLGADDPWYCPKCKKHQQATKKFDIWSLPKVLIIHLKRFSFSRSWRDKIDTLVEFPIDNLDLSKYVSNPIQKQKRQLIYNLIGVANHFGGLGGGHYTAYAKNVLQDAWYSFDDALVTPANSNNVVTRNAYVLFYQLDEESQT